jgi:DNA-binding NarL/FixJ family response regulator
VRSQNRIYLKLPTCAIFPQWDLVYVDTNCFSRGSRLAIALGSRIRTLVVEDHKAFLDFITATARNCASVEVIGEVQDGFSAVQRAAQLQPDLILLDIGLPGLNGIDAARRIRSVSPDSRIIFVTQESSPDIVEAAFTLGAWGYVMKIHAGVELPLALNAVVKGNKFFGNGLPQYASTSSSVSA